MAHLLVYIIKLFPVFYRFKVALFISWILKPVFFFLRSQERKFLTSRSWVLKRLVNVNMDISLYANSGEIQALLNEKGKKLILGYHSSVNGLLRIYLNSIDMEVITIGADEKWNMYGYSFENQIRINQNTLINTRSALNSGKTVFAFVDFWGNKFNKNPSRTTMISLPDRKMRVSKALFILGSRLKAHIFFMETLPYKNGYRFRIHRCKDNLYPEEYISEFKNFLKN